MKVIFATFLAVIVFVLAYLYFYLGYYKPVEFKSQKMPVLHIFYKTHIGPYHKIVPLLNEIENDFKKIGTTCDYTFGRFLDNPEKAPEDRLRAEVGCLFFSHPHNLKFPEGLSESHIDEKEYLVGNFEGAPSVGPLKVYPNAKEWFKKYGYTFPDEVIEIYKVLPDNGVQTQYLFSIQSTPNP